MKGTLEGTLEEGGKLIFLSTPKSFNDHQVTEPPIPHL